MSNQRDDDQDQPSMLRFLFDEIKTVVKEGARFPFALAASVVVIIVATIVTAIGKGDDINWGGLVGLLFGNKPSRTDVANVVPDGRDADLGEKGKEDYTQVEVESIDDGLLNPFRDKSKLKLKTGETIQLPNGVQDKDVDEVFRIDPETFEIKVKGTPDDYDWDAIRSSLNGSRDT